MLFNGSQSLLITVSQYMNSTSQSILYLRLCCIPGLVEEGEVLTRVGFIQSGRCKALMIVPQTRPRAQVEVMQNQLLAIECTNASMVY